MSTHPIVRYYNANMQRVPRPYVDAVCPPTTRGGDPYPLVTLFCLRCDLPFQTPVIRSLCEPCNTSGGAIPRWIRKSA